jgi:uncharacterized membrane protein YccF (DUF307 family)
MSDLPAEPERPPSPPGTRAGSGELSRSLRTPEPAAQAPAALPGSAVTAHAPTVSAVATVNVTQNVLVMQRRHGPGFFTRAIWYLFVGWWLTGFAIGIAWVCALTVLLLPVSFLIVAKIPTILTLRPRSIETDVRVGADGSVRVRTGGALQRPFWQRALWFLFVGWWACLVAMLVGYALSLTILLLPVGVMIFNRVPAVMTLQRN